MNHRNSSRDSRRRAWCCRSIIAAPSLAIALFFFTSQLVYAATINVTTPHDVVDANGGVCAGLTLADLPGPDGYVSLREALCAANTNPNADTIVLPENVYLITLAGSGEDGNAVGDFDVLETGGNLTIQGAGSSKSIIDGNGAVIGDRVLDLPPLNTQIITVIVKDVTLQHGSLPAGLGGGIYVDRPHNLSLENSFVYSNTAKWGGGIYTRLATLQVSDSTISENLGTERGGGIYHDVGSGSVILTNSSISDNRVTYAGNAVGGGIYNSTGSIQISSSTLKDNHAISSGFRGTGGALYNDEGDVDISGSRLLNNVATGWGQEGQGGAIQTDQGNLSIIYSTVSGNIAQDSNGGSSYGGGIFIASTVATVTHSTIVGNWSTGSNGVGGGIFVNNGSLVVTNTTISGNMANANGGGIYNTLGNVLLDHVTITANVADYNASTDGVGGGICRNIQPVYLKNTILADNVDGSPTGLNIGADCFGSMFSYGYNLIGDETSCESTAWKTSDQVGGNGNPVIDPQLGSLADNGGGTHTHALKSGSPAVDAGSCTDIGGASVSYDQRMLDRPQGVACDIGAYEAEPTLSITKTVAPASNVPCHGVVTYAIAVTNSGAGSALSVDVADVLPANVLFSRWLPGGKPAGATMTGGNLAWSGTVPSNQTISFAFVVTHCGNYGDRVTNTALFNHAGGNGSAGVIFEVESDTGARIYLPTVIKTALP